METQRWSTRWKTRRWPWDSAVTVLITFAILLRAAEVRGGKKATGGRSPVASLLRSQRRTSGTAGAAFQRLSRCRGSERARSRWRPARGAETRWAPPAAQARGAPPRSRGGTAAVPPQRVTSGGILVQERERAGGVGRWKKDLLNEWREWRPFQH